jgi:Mg2+ and Co2+ transporter CorA
MNFKMPEYEQAYAYPIAVVVNITFTVGLVIWLRRKHWL